MPPRSWGKLKAEATIVLGSLYLAAGQPGTAFRHFEEGQDLARPLHARSTTISAIIGMAASSTDPNLAREAVALARVVGMHVLEARALIALAQVELGQGNHEDARASAECALAMSLDFGSRPVQEQAQAVLRGCP